MTLSKQLFSLLFLFLLFFPLRYAFIPNKCSSSFSNPLRCGPLEVPIRFPFCDHSDFNLHCNDLNKTVLELPMSGTFLVQNIDYRGREIYISDPEGCLVKRLLNFNLSGSPFFPPFLSILYTFLTCPKGVVLPLHPPIPCLSNSTISFFVTSNYDLAKSMLHLCQIVKRLPVPGSWPLGFSMYAKNESLLLEWDSPNCTRCEMDNLRCGFKRKYSLEVKCLGAKKTGGLSSGIIALICLSIIVFFGFSIYMNISIYKSNQRFESQRDQQNGDIVAVTVSQQPRETMVRTGLEQSTVDSYKKVVLGESRRLSGTNGIVCPICLSEYSTKDTVRCIPECDHCFHVECIDPWLKIHGSCPVCRNLLV